MLRVGKKSFSVGLVDSPGCILCRIVEESVEHAFFSLCGCKFVETYIVCMFFVLETSSQCVAMFLCLLGIYSSMDNVTERNLW